MPRGLEEGLVIVLAVDVDEGSPHLGEAGDVGEPPVQSAPAPARCRNLPHED